EVVARPLGEHPLALGALAHVIGGSGYVDDQGRPRERLVTGGRARLPDVLADGQTDAMAAEVDHTPAGAGLEVSLLVEDAVVGQIDLPVGRVELAVGQDRRGVV